MLLQSIGKISQRLQDGVTSASDLCAACLQRAKTIENLNAFVYLNKDKVYEQANKSDERYKNKTPKGKVDGLPIAVKDNFCTEGIKTTCGSKMLNNFIPTYNATIVQRLQDKGAVIFGKCNLDEFAMGSGTVDSVHGYTYNVWGSKLKYNVKRNGEIVRKNNQDMKERIAGGSSGGSAVAVASGACFAALGSDTGGSTRNPASYCGVVGLKPTYGRVSRYGLIPLVNSMDVPGIITRKVEDAVDIFNIISGPDPKDSTTVPATFPDIQLKRDLVMSGVRVGIPKEYHCPGTSPEVLQAWSNVADILEEAGATVRQVSLPHTPLSIVCYSILNQCEVASNMSRYDGLEFGHRAKAATSTEQLFAKTRSEAFNNVVRGRILAGNYFLLQRNYNRYFTQALKVRRLIAEDFEKVWNQGIDLLLTPTTLSEPAELQEFLKLDNRAQCVAQDYCTQPVNMAGCPAVSVPTYLSEKGFPLSLQLIAPNFQEERLLSVAHWIESAVQFPELEIYDDKVGLK